ncbi:MAG TPA: LysR family transcriptional regulator [Tabrizicola sp.]|nr:LysR family transcriptional regulator [Tabrizicola sp.]
MELRQIQYFVAIAELEHFVRASQRLRIAQPALSRQMKLLEAELGVELFERLPRGIRLTDAGRVLLSHLREVNAQIAAAVTATKAAAVGRLGVLRLGVIEVAAWQGIVPESIRRFRAGFPEVELLLSSFDSAAQLTAIRRGGLDAGFLYNAPADPSLAVRPLRFDPVVLAVPEASPLAGRKGLSIGDLAQEPFIGFRRHLSPRYFDDTQAAFRKAGIEPRIIAEMGTEADMLALVGSGMGIAFVNASQAWRPPHSVRFVEVADFEVGLQLCFVHLKDNTSAVVAHMAEIAEGLAKADR